MMKAILLADVKKHLDSLRESIRSSDGNIFGVILGVMAGVAFFLIQLVFMISFIDKINLGPLPFDITFGAIIGYKFGGEVHNNDIKELLPKVKKFSAFLQGIFKQFMDTTKQWQNLKAIPDPDPGDKFIEKNSSYVGGWKVV